ncbi:Fic family protein [Sulfurimonas sp. SWIR-19]|uniref:Fic family protein n=1 Tax=Sulfurimonas sp. SWIR-19 TaxID=2878390 RepID=UPI001CF55727|nr:Fic family protein [Sulfurimonas sp. SWIR-19]UCN00508.1 Fic family protein [Sulfurimonas sp. SWIR-19]
MPEYTPPYTITSKMLTLSTSIGEELTKIEFEANKTITPMLRKKNRIKTLAGTLEIEGNFLGEDKITAILDGKRVLGTYEEVLEVEGAINAYKEFENYNYDNLDDLLKAHKILMKGILKTAGSFRGVNVGVGSKDGVSHVAPPFCVVPDLMRDLFGWLKNSDEHLLIKSCVFHYEFEFIHPFNDGNGRIGRLWQSVILYHWKKIFSAIPTESIIRDNQERYYEVLEESGNLGESTPFVEFMLEVILKAIGNAKKSNVPKNVPKNVPLKRVAKIVSLINKNKNITIIELANILKVTDKTIKRDIAKLKKENKLVRVGSLKTGHWEIKE